MQPVSGHTPISRIVAAHSAPLWVGALHQTSLFRPCDNHTLGMTHQRTDWAAGCLVSASREVVVIRPRASLKESTITHTCLNPGTPQASTPHSARSGIFSVCAPDTADLEAGEDGGQLGGRCDQGFPRKEGEPCPTPQPIAPPQAGRPDCGFIPQRDADSA